MFTPLCHCPKEGLPVLIQRSQHLLRDFAWQGLIGGMSLHQLMHLVVVQIDTLFDEGLPYLVVGSIVQVFRGKSRLIYGIIAGVSFADHVLFNQLHREPPIPVQSSQSCVWPYAGHTCGRKSCTVWRLNQPTSPLYRSLTH